MNYSRPEAKLRAQASIRGAYPHPALVTLIYVLITGVLTSILLGLVHNPLQDYYIYLILGYDPEDALAYLMSNTGGWTIYIVLQILLSLYTAVVSFGYTSYALRLARNEQPGYRNLLDGFSTMGRVLLTTVLRGIFVWLWGMLGMLPGIIVTVLGIATASTIAGPILVSVGIPLMIAGGVFEVAISYRYRLSEYFLLDNPGMGPLAAITASKHAMKGWKGTLFVQDLSFLGWNILSSLTFGILGLWVTPYQCAAEANFYDFAVHGGYSSPDFRQNPNGAPNGRPGPEF